MKYCNQPESETVFSKLLFLLFLVLLLLLLSSCRTTSNTTAIVPVHSATHDTILLSKVKYDSIYIDRWQRIERKADTVFYDRAKQSFVTASSAIQSIRLEPTQSLLSSKCLW